MIKNVLFVGIGSRQHDHCGRQTQSWLINFWWKGIDIRVLTMAFPVVVRRPISAGLWQAMQRSDDAPLSGVWTGEAIGL